MTEGLKSHWEEVYKTKSVDEVSWYQPQSTKSIELIQSAHPARTTNIIDIGSGASILIDQLLENGYQNITALDISEAALQKTQSRVGENKVNWIVSDIIEWCPCGSYDVWHDRAVFHFQTSQEDIVKYISCLKDCLKVGGSAIISTFALDGPEKCSGLPVKRYSPETLAQELGAEFKLIASDTETHVTPWGSEQKFQYSRLVRV